MNGPCMNGVVRSNSALSEASRANTMTASQRSVKFVPAGETQNGRFGECQLFQQFIQESDNVVTKSINVGHTYYSMYILTHCLIFQQSIKRQLKKPFQE